MTFLFPFPTSMSSDGGDDDKAGDEGRDIIHGRCIRPSSIKPGKECLGRGEAGLT